ncbi:hypothetical protein [uncultured Desulfosarcina sp.]|uniref:hypothetical protein n=1 Tax=uncultured Desulfosarcina sp. TaxID=218289 RepID=UPI0029C98D48|nr:hypothetical protein [uncultured Desulfosarcina sp.]
MSHRFGPMGKPAGCRICGRSLSFHQQVSGQICDDWRCKSTVLDKEMAAHRKKAAAVLGVRRPESYPMVVVPDDPADVERLPDLRKQVHAAFLYDLCVKGFQAGIDGGEDPLDINPPEIGPPAVVASRVCGVCRGTCCHLGKEHAFLDAAAIGRFAARCGIADPLDIVHAYTAYLPQISVKDACVYQSEQGCTLPRWMRADICNTYRCQGLKQAERLIRNHETSRLYVVVRKDNRIARAAFVQNRRVRPYPLTLRLSKEKRHAAGSPAKV